MNPCNRNVNCLRAVAIIATIAATLCVSAQQVKPTDSSVKGNDEIVNMDVFSVSSTKGKSYGTSSLASATRLNTPAENVPQTVSVINANLIADLSAYEYEQAVRYVPNVTQRQNQANGTMIRGLNSSNRYRNGFRLPNYESDMVNIDRIEIVKGAAASISGATESAGYVNMITKKPLWKPQGEISLTAGTGDFIRFQFDQTGTLGDTTAYRISGATMRSHGWRDFEEYKKLAVFPSFLWKITKNFEWLNEVEYIYSMTPGSYGTPYLAETYGNTANKIAVPANAQIGLGRWADVKYSTSDKNMNRTNTVATLFSTLTYRISQYLSAREAFLVFRNNGSLYRGELGDNFSYTSTGDLVVGRWLSKGNAGETGYRNQGDVAFNYKTKNEMVGLSTLAGYEIIRATSDNVQQYSTTTNISLINDQNRVLPPLGAPTESYTRSGSSAMFINGQLSFWREFAIITAGFRRDMGYSGDVRNKITGAVKSNPKGPDVDSPLYGLTLKPAKWIALYGVYSEAGAPQQTVSIYPQLPVGDPQQQWATITPNTTNKEFGVKTNFFKGNLSINLAHFNIERHDVTRDQTDTSAPGGRIRIVEPGDSSKGWELEWSGMVTKDLIIYGGYAYMDTTASGFKPDGKSQRELRGIPRNKIQMFARYDLPLSGVWKGLAVKAGVVSQGSVYGRPENTYKVDGATRIDLGLEYAKAEWRFSLTAENITDVIFPTYTVGQGSNTVDAPRTFYFTATRKL